MHADKKPHNSHLLASNAKVLGSNPGWSVIFLLTILYVVRSHSHLLIIDHGMV